MFVVKLQCLDITMFIWPGRGADFCADIKVVFLVVFFTYS